jgi:hypothetical protein
MDAQQQLFGLMAVAEEHQKAVKAAIDGLTAERAAFAKERAALSQAAASLSATASAALPAIQKAAGEAVGASVRQSLAGASDVAAKALGEAAKPVLGRLAGVVKAASDAEGSLKNAGKWFAWKWVSLAAGGLAGVCLVAYASLAWQMHQVEQLTAEAAELRATVLDLANRGGRIQLTNCGDKKRLCVQVDKKDVFGKDSDFLILKGY